MSRVRVKVYTRARSTNSLDNIFDARTTPKTIRTDSNQMFREMVQSNVSEGYRVRTQF